MISFKNYGWWCQLSTNMATTVTKNRKFYKKFNKKFWKILGHPVFDFAIKELLIFIFLSMQWPYTCTYIMYMKKNYIKSRQIDIGTALTEYFMYIFICSTKKLTKLFQDRLKFCLTGLDQHFFVIHWFSGFAFKMEIFTR